MKQGSMLEDQFSYLIQQSNSYKRLQIDAKTTICWLRLSQNNKYLAIFHYQKEVGLLTIWDLSSQKVKCSINVPKLWSENGMSTFSKDNKYFFFALYNADKLQIISLESRRGTITDCKLGGALKEMAISINPLYCCTVTSEQCLFWNQDTKHVDKKIVSDIEFMCCCFKNNDKELIAISCQEQEETIIACWSTTRLKVIREWKCKYISSQAKCYVIEDIQILIVDYYEVYEHYMQIWSILNQSLIRSLYQTIESFTIMNNFGTKLVVDCEEDDEDDDDYVQKVDERNKNQWISFFDVLTFKYQKFNTFFEYGKRYFVFEGALIIENRKQNSNNTEIFINFK